MMTTQMKRDVARKSGHQTVRLQRKEVTETGEFEGYGSVFGNVDSHNDIVMPGAFTDSLEEHNEKGTMPAMLWQHDPYTPIGVYTEMKEDDRGLFVKGKLALETQVGREAHELLKMGALDGLSIGYRIDGPDGWDYDEDKGAFLLKRLKLWEVSIVTFASNDQATVDDVKQSDMIAGFADLKSCESHLREVGGFSCAEAKAMVAAVKRIAQKDREDRQSVLAILASQKRLLKVMQS